LSLSLRLPLRTSETAGHSILGIQTHLEKNITLTFGYGVDIKVDGIMLFDYDDDILMFFNEIYAEQLIGKKIKMTYREKENYFHEIVPVVTNLISN
jgi:hypothetical protein